MAAAKPMVSARLVAVAADESGWDAALLGVAGRTGASARAWRRARGSGLDQRPHWCRSSDPWSGPRSGQVRSSLRSSLRSWLGLGVALRASLGFRLGRRAGFRFGRGRVRGIGAGICSRRRDACRRWRSILRSCPHFRPATYSRRYSCPRSSAGRNSHCHCRHSFRWKRATVGWWACCLSAHAACPVCSRWRRARPQKAASRCFGRLRMSAIAAMMSANAWHQPPTRYSTYSTLQYPRRIRSHDLPATCLQPAGHRAAGEKPWECKALDRTRRSGKPAAITRLGNFCRAIVVRRPAPVTMAKRKRDAYNNGHITKAAKLAKAAGRCQEHRRIAARTPVC